MRKIATAAVMVLLVSSASAQVETSVIELQKRAAESYREEMLNGGGPSTGSNGNSADKAFVDAFGSIFGLWLKQKVMAKPTYWVENVPKCIQEYLRDPTQHTRAAKPSLPSFKLGGRDRWIVLYHRKQLADAIEVGCWLGTEFPSVQTFRTRASDYAIVVGTATEQKAQSIIRRYVTSGDFPPETFTSLGADFEDRVWAAPDIVATESKLR